MWFRCGFEVIERLKNFLITLYVVVGVYLDWEVYKLVSILFLNAVHHFAMKFFGYGIKESSNLDMILHHILCIVLTGLYLIYYYDEFILKVTIEILKIEISSIFLTYMNLLKELKINHISTHFAKFLFFVSFLYFRSYNSYNILVSIINKIENDPKIYYYYVYYSFAFLYILNIFWTFKILNVIYKIIYPNSKKMYKSIELNLRFTFSPSILIVLYFLFKNFNWINILFLFSTTWLSISSYNYHNKISENISNEEFNPLTENLKDAYLFDCMAIQFNSLIITMILTNPNLAIFSNCIHIFTITNISNTISNSTHNSPTLKFLAKLPFIIDSLIILYSLKFNTLSLNLFILSTSIITTYIIKPFNHNSMYLIHTLSLISLYLILTKINQQ